MMRPLIGEAMRAKGADLVADNRDLTTHSAAQDLMRETDRIGVLSRVLHGPRVLAVFLRDIAFRFRRWREDQRACAALSHLDDPQLKEFRIYPRPPGLTNRRFS